MKNMKIGARISLGFSVLLLSAVAITSYLNVNRLDAEIETLTKDKWVKSEVLNDLAYRLDDISIALRDMLLTDSAEVRQKEAAIITKACNKIALDLDKLDKMSLSETGKRHLAAIRTTRDIYMQDSARFQALLLANKLKETTEAKALLAGTLADKKRDYSKAIDEMESYQSKEMERIGAECDRMANTTNTITLMIWIFTLIFGIILAFWLARSITRPLLFCVDSAERIAAGNLDIRLETTATDETGALLQAMAKMTVAIRLMISDGKLLADDAIAGKLATRADAARHQGDFRIIIEGFNKTLDAVIGPLNVSAEYMERISKGEIPPKITENYNGDFNEIKNNLNVCIEAVGAMVEAGKTLTAAAVAGNLTVRADATKHQGDFRSIINGFNETLDAVIGPLNVSAEYMDRISKGDIPPKITERYNGDFNEIKNNLNVCIEAVGAMVTDSKMLTSSAAAGNLTIRADATKHQGDFRVIIQGFNETMDVVVTPINEVRSVMESMAGRDLNRRMTGDARGELTTLKDSLNSALNSISTAIVNVTQNARQVAAAAAQTSEAVGQISDGSQNQLHAISQVATAVKQTASSIADVSRNTEEASLRAKDSVVIVNDGQAKMAQMVKVVNNIVANSEKINKITDVIEKIANKTNLLSLNAAIEAARAGEHGRGFAVVAEEVGKLAANAADSTQEIVELVNQAVKEANKAVTTVNEVSSGMQKISDGALQTESMLQRISAALEEQSSAVQEINVNIISLNKVAESNASASEEITATIVELARLADNTRKEAEQFRV